jgi:N utilization substance protein B
MTRTNARELAAQMVYEMELTEKPAEELLSTRLDDGYYETLRGESELYDEKPDKQLDYLRATLLGVEAHRDELNGYIRKYAIGWDLSRISRVARAIMLVCMYECLYVEDVPVGAAINEAVELTRKYEDEDVVSFVNGILGSFAREAAAK